MMSHLRLRTQLSGLLFLLFAMQPLAAEPIGYHYDRPFRPSGPSGPPAEIGVHGSVYTGHHFSPLPTVQPLPPVPALPPLPTAHSSIPRTHPLPAAHPGSILSRYLPTTHVTPAAAPIANAYLPTTYASPIASYSYHGVAPTQQTHGAQLLQQPIHVPSAPAAPQPLRIPYGKQALISPGESYVANGRQLKQYAVIEIIDNDIDETPAPFLASTFFDRYRAHLGATGTGATGSGLQLESRANALLLEQQALGIQPRIQDSNPRQGDAIALGSGSLGYIRLANGNVFLGSGSLGYISGQQRVASVLEARTRSEATSDALHFGHGPLGGADNFLRYK